jgi:hypothetical protein
MQVQTDEKKPTMGYVCGNILCRQGGTRLVRHTYYLLKAR